MNEPNMSRQHDSPTETTTASDNAHIQSIKFALPKGARDIFIATIMSMSIITSVILAFLLHDAYKDIQTQVWLRDDALTKFMTGPYADLRAEVKATQIVLASQCNKPKESK
jgi:hypothetical protein